MYKEKVRELLKEVPEVKEQMEKLEEGCILSDGFYILKIDNKISETHYNCTGKKIGNTGRTFSNSYGFGKDLGNYKNIGLPLQERFLRMYCDNKSLFYSFDNKNIYVETRILLENNEDGIFTIDIDNTKDFDSQSEDFYKELYEALSQLKN